MSGIFSRRDSRLQWVPGDDYKASFHWQDAHHSNESSWKAKEVPLGDDRILVLDAD